MDCSDLHIASTRGHALQLRTTSAALHRLSPAELSELVARLAPQRAAEALYLSFASVMDVAAVIVLLPGAPLIQILFLTQALNAVLLLPLLWFIRGIAGDRVLMGEAAVGRRSAVASAVVLALVSVSVVLLPGVSL